MKLYPSLTYGKQHPRTLHFPVERPSDKLVSAEATDLISQILQEKEYRLCSRKYMLNDYLHSKGPYGLLNRRADGASKDYKGFYVYPDDASDIKAHPFFEGIRWDELHFRKPPFIPKVKSWEDTKYFEEEEPISDIDDTSSAIDSLDPVPLPDKGIGIPMMNALDSGPCHKIPLRAPVAKETKSNYTTAQQAMKTSPPIKTPLKVYKRKKEKKRPRDKILRDEAVGKTVMDIRKRGAFLGYTYRRPRGLNILLRNESAVNLFGSESHARYYVSNYGLSHPLF
jgi:hypothetical protein